jgi:pimeloyl-ACP methyl ester carboxylesterase
MLAIVGIVIAATTVFNLERRLGVGVLESSHNASFYSLPSTLLPGEPGQIIRSAPIRSAPLGSVAWRVIYHSRDAKGEDVAVSGVIVAPVTPPPPGGRTTVAWAHPTTGTDSKCAPSLEIDPFLAIEGLHELLAAGYVIAATDYQGLGVPGNSSYLLGIPEANNVLDAARAVRNIDALQTSNRVLLWGHSQGGQAALFAAQRASTYAPELKLLGVAVAAPAAGLNALMSADIRNISGVTIASYAVPAYTQQYSSRVGASAITAILTPAGLAATPSMNTHCLLTQTSALHDIARPLIGKYVVSDPSTTEPWQTLLHENSAGGDPIHVPVYIGQGLADQLVAPSATVAYATLLCSQGADVSFHEFPGVSHGLAAYVSIPTLMPWLNEVNKGARPASSC